MTAPKFETSLILHPHPDEEANMPPTVEVLLNGEPFSELRWSTHGFVGELPRLEGGSYAFGERTIGAYRTEIAAQNTRAQEKIAAALASEERVLAAYETTHPEQVALACGDLKDGQIEFDGPPLRLVGARKVECEHAVALFGTERIAPDWFEPMEPAPISFDLDAASEEDFSPS